MIVDNEVMMIVERKMSDILEISLSRSNGAHGSPMEFMYSICDLKRTLTDLLGETRMDTTQLRERKKENKQRKREIQYKRRM